MSSSAEGRTHPSAVPAVQGGLAKVDAVRWKMIV